MKFLDNALLVAMCGAGLVLVVVICCGVIGLIASLGVPVLLAILVILNL